MKETLNKVDRTLRKGIQIFLGCAMILLTGIVFMQVIYRYVTKTSMGGVEELPQYLMIVSVWFAASYLTAENKHISLDITSLVIKSKRVMAFLNIITDTLAAGALIYFTRCMIDYTILQKEQGVVSSGLKFPMWFVGLVISVNAVLMIIYTIKNILAYVEELKHGNDN